MESSGLLPLAKVPMEPWDSEWSAPGICRVACICRGHLPKTGTRGDSTGRPTGRKAQYTVRIHKISIVVGKYKLDSNVCLVK